MNKVIIAIVVVAVVLVGGYFLFKGTYQPAATAPQASSEQTTSQPPVPGEPSGGITPQPPVAQVPAREVREYVVTYTDAGYAPATLKVKRGEAVTFKNQSSQSLWTASGVHPSHRVYSGTSLDEHCPDTANTAFDACQGVLPGQSWSFTFNKVGTWGYHNHLSPGDRGVIVVE